MEVERNEKPKKDFLKKVRQFASQKRIVLIFDECTSAIRETFGGLHKKYKVNPDIAVFGKSIANGIPLTAVIGKKEIMDFSKQSFISSTFWTDSLGPASALSTLQQMEKVKSWEKISYIGKKIKKEWEKIGKKYNITLKFQDWTYADVYFCITKKPILQKFYYSEMLKKNILASNTVYCCIHHDKYLNLYLKN